MAPNPLTQYAESREIDQEDYPRIAWSLLSDFTEAEEKVDDLTKGEEGIDWTRQIVSCALRRVLTAEGIASWWDEPIPGLDDEYATPNEMWDRDRQAVCRLAFGVISSAEDD